MSDLAELLKIAEAATPGPWHLSGRLGPRDGSEGFYRISAASTLSLEVRPCADGYVPGQNAANAAHIAAFNPTVAKALVRAAMAAAAVAEYSRSTKYGSALGQDLYLHSLTDLDRQITALTLALKGSNHG